MSAFDEYYEAVGEIRDYLNRDLFGPVMNDEILENVEPLNTYVCGILWPQKLDSSVIDDDDEDDAPEDVEDPEDMLITTDDSMSNANVFKPTSMGISLLLPNEGAHISIIFSGAKYSHEEEHVNERIVHRYLRAPFSKTIETDIQKRIGTRKIFHDKELGFEITLSLRQLFDDGSKLITVTVQNNLRAKQKGVDQSTSSLFQCRLTISSEKPLLPVYHNNALIVDAEEKISRLQHRNIKNYAYGHGCSVFYEENPGGVFCVESDFLPSEQVYQMMPGTIKNEEILNLVYWRTAARETGCKQLTQFINEYQEWREKQAAIAETIDNMDFRTASDLVLIRIDECISRLRNGVRILLEDNLSWNSFKLMNEAMLLQRIKTKKTKEQDVNWYPFQLAYILQIIPDIVNDKSVFRDSVDLLWFPTGGGKTEAYLGIAAFVIFYRRLSGKADKDGVTIIMRYTLRLLTIQQFERATALICACEHLRKKNGISGGEINIGLWIGSSMTPNHIEQAKDVLDKLKENPNERIFEGNPVQITKCPWCGQKIDLNSYTISGNALQIRCADNPNCEFHTSLPIYVVDDDIYRVRPTLLLSTVDKFARITWEENTRSLFGEGCPPPELIIQDELHLISGPLGSLSGIYEIALEYLCGKTGKYPKIIASTATVKNAREQIHSLYNRNTVQFPPAGVNYDNSFFAMKADAGRRPARTYMGLCETGGSIADLLIRIYATLFFTKTLFIKQGKSKDVIDQYFTTVGYFNALKDLGASSTIIQDRIFTHIRNLVARTFKAESERYNISPNDIKVFEHSELTSRKSSKEIKDTLDQLALRYDDSACYSYVLASNMLSVGIDIDRLGVMTVYNQPKSNAEYIQATSRVGRQNPGLVLAMYNNMRSRDKSHYEQFGYYHKSFYRYVEATSVTPFAMRAIEKALHCVFVALVRLTIPGLSSNESARYFRADIPAVGKVRDYLLKRVGEIMPSNSDYATTVLSDFANVWEEIAIENSNTLFYKSYNGYPSLLSSAEDDSELGLPKILNSLRNVDPTVNVYFRR
jgi:hypothetical protein